jgi:polyhydroxyalkanoate synthesis regulator phasin
MGQTIEQLKSMMQAEKKAREHDYGQAQGRIRELEEQLAEFEEEHINL